MSYHDCSGALRSQSEGKRAGVVIIIIWDRAWPRTPTLSPRRGDGRRSGDPRPLQARRSLQPIHPRWEQDVRSFLDPYPSKRGSGPIRIPDERKGKPELGTRGGRTR